MPNNEPPAFNNNDETPPMNPADNLPDAAERAADFARQALTAVDAAVRKGMPHSANEVIKALTAQQQNEATHSERYAQNRVTWNVINLGILGTRGAEDNVVIQSRYIHLPLPPHARDVVNSEGLTTEAKDTVAARYNADWHIAITEVGEPPKPGTMLDLNSIEDVRHRDIARAAAEGWNSQTAHITETKAAEAEKAANEKLVAQERELLPRLIEPSTADWDVADAMLAGRAYREETFKVFHDHLVHNPQYRQLSLEQKKILFIMYSNNGGEFHNKHDCATLDNHQIPRRLVINEDQLGVEPTRIESARKIALLRDQEVRRMSALPTNRWRRHNPAIEGPKKTSARTLRPGGRGPGGH